MGRPARFLLEVPDVLSMYSEQNARILRMESLHNLVCSALGIAILGIAVVLLYRTTVSIRGTSARTKADIFHNKVYVIFCYACMLVLGIYMADMFSTVCSFNLWLNILEPGSRFHGFLLNVGI